MRTTAFLVPLVAALGLASCDSDSSGDTAAGGDDGAGAEAGDEAQGGDDAPTPPVSPPSSDDFDSEADLLGEHDSDWQVLHPDRADTVTIGEGRMTIVAKNGERWGWYEDFHAMLVYRMVSGNFAVAAKLRVIDDSNPEQPPTGEFNAGGFIVRDPAGSHSGDENWVMYNFGQQRDSYAREVKKTVDSSSRLYLNPQPFEEDALLVCRVGNAFHFFVDEGGTWVEERFQPDATTSNGSAPHPSEVDRSGAGPLYFELALPQTVQVGLMAASWSSPDDSKVRAEVDYVRFAATPPQSVEDCTKGL